MTVRHDHRRPTRARTLISAILVACTGPGLLSGCTAAHPDTEASTSAEGSAWASEVEAFFQAWDAAELLGFTNSAPFYARGAHFDTQAWNGFEGVGRPAIVQNLRDNIQIPPRFVVGGFDQTDATGPLGNRVDEPPYLSRWGVLSVTNSAGYSMRSAQATRITDQGVSDQTGSWSVTTTESLFAIPVGSLLAPALHYLDAWSSGGSADVAELYDPQASLHDSLASLDVTGADVVAALATRDVADGGLIRATLHDLPDDGGPAVYVGGDFTGMLRGGSDGAAAIDTYTLLLDTDPPEGCPGPVAVVLKVGTDGRIRHEERYHRIDALRRCLPAGDRPSGWWDDVRIPSTPGIRLTGWSAAPTHDIAIWNGDPLVDPIIAWARRRFASVGLPPPQPTSVTFLPPGYGADRWEALGFVTGSDAPDLGLPFTADEACPAGPCRWPSSVRAATLHEFAHLWLAPARYQGWPSYDNAWTRVTKLLDTHDLTWHDPALPWAQQGAERAAETIAWGLMDQPYTIDPRLGPLTCAQLTTDFQTLTNTTPDPRACAETVGANGGADS